MPYINHNAFRNKALKRERAKLEAREQQIKEVREAERQAAKDNEKRLETIAIA